MYRSLKNEKKRNSRLWGIRCSINDDDVGSGPEPPESNIQHAQWTMTTKAAYISLWPQRAITGDGDLDLLSRNYAGNSDYHGITLVIRRHLRSMAPAIPMAAQRVPAGGLLQRAMPAWPLAAAPITLSYQRSQAARKLPTRRSSSLTNAAYRAQGNPG